MKKTPDFDAAAEFMAARARVLDRRVFQRLFQGGAPEPVRDAIAAYRNDDGGFGHALEPDLRAAASQPAAVEMALRIMDAADAWDEHLVRGAVDWLASIAPAEGGATFVLPTLSQGPHAPWWVPAEGNPVSLIQTGEIAGVLYARGFAHPWRDGATEVMWRGIDQLTEPMAYEMFGVLAFLQHVPDRSRANDALQRVGRLLSTAASSRSTRTPRARRTPPWTSLRSPTRSPDRFSTTPRSRPTWTTWQALSARTAAGCSTGPRGRQPPSPTGEASSRSTPSACSAPTAARSHKN